MVMTLEEWFAIKKTVVEENDWRHRPENVYVEDGQALVAIAPTDKRSIKESIRATLEAIGGTSKALKPTDKVLIKANYNSDDPFPASSDPEFVAAAVEILREDGITDLTLGERSGWRWMPTKDVLDNMGLTAKAKEIGLPVEIFDDGPWMDVRLGDWAKWWDAVGYHASLKDYDKIVYLPCMKHHFAARFTISLKLTVGLTHVADMPYLHADTRGGKPEEPMEEKLPELIYPVKPDLIIVDARKSFITGGPFEGDVVEPGVILAGGDQVAVDCEGVKILQTYQAENRLGISFWEMPAVKRSVELGQGVASEEEIRVIRV